MGEFLLFNTTQRAWIPKETKDEIAKHVKTKGLNLDKLGGTIHRHFGNISKSSALKSIYGNQHTPLKVMNFITGLTGLRFKMVGDKWYPDTVDFTMYTFEGEINKAVHTIRGETITDTTPYDGIEVLVARLNRMSNKKACEVTGKPAKWQILELNGVAV